jgi:hypothetical protein
MKKPPSGGFFVSCAGSHSFVRMIVRRVFVLHVAEFLMGMVVCLRNMRMRMSGIVAGMRRRVTVLVSVRVTMAVRVGMAVHQVPVPMQVLVHVIVRMGVLVRMGGGCFRLFRHGFLLGLARIRRHRAI